MYFTVSRQAYQRIIREDYRQRTAGKSDAEKALNMKEVWDWVDNHSIGVEDTGSFKSVTARMIATQTQLTTLV